MSNVCKKKVTEKDRPAEFCTSTFNTIMRIEENPNVYGVVYFRGNYTKLCTVPESMAAPLSLKLPHFTTAAHRAVMEIKKDKHLDRNIWELNPDRSIDDVRDELVAYRIETRCLEISLVRGKQFAACVVHKKIGSNKSKKTKKKLGKYLESNYKRNYIMKILSNLLKDTKDEWLINETISLNQVNPIVDRIMEDESVEGVVMTNQDGSPILTNINVMGATNYGTAMRRLGFMAQAGVKEIDPFDEILMLRLKTQKIEVMVAHHKEFNVIVLQHSRVSKIKK